MKGRVGIGRGSGLFVEDESVHALPRSFHLTLSLVFPPIAKRKEKPRMSAFKYRVVCIVYLALAAT